jgi:hypothetical protein
MLAELTAALSAARGGAGGAVLLTGEAGIGKTTVAEEIARCARADGVPVLVGRASADEGAPAYWVWRRALSALDDGDLLVTGADPAVAEAAAAERFRVAERVRGALVAAAEPGGLVLVIEDVQWADEASVSVLRHLLREVADARLARSSRCRPTGCSGRGPGGCWPATQSPGRPAATRAWPPCPRRCDQLVRSPAPGGGAG